MAIDPPLRRTISGRVGGISGRSVPMLQPPENKNSTQFASNPNTYTPVKTSSAPMEQATIGRSLTIKGEISGGESLYIDGRLEGTINIPEHRVTVGRNGIVTADVNAREVVIMGKVQGNVICSDRLDIRSEGAVTGDVVTQRISVEDGAILKGSVQVRAHLRIRVQGVRRRVRSAPPRGSSRGFGRPALPRSPGRWARKNLASPTLNRIWSRN